MILPGNAPCLHGGCFQQDCQHLLLLALGYYPKGINEFLRILRGLA